MSFALHITLDGNLMVVVREVESRTRGLLKLALCFRELYSNVCLVSVALHNKLLNYLNSFVLRNNIDNTPLNSTNHALRHTQYIQ